MSYVLSFLGSPRRGGNTEILLDEVLRGAKKKGAQTEKIILNELNVCPCQECGGCDTTGRCVVKDDMQAIYPKLRQADAVVIASPVFFSSLSAQTKAMIDRNQCLWVEKYRLKKPVTESKGPRPAPYGVRARPDTVWYRARRGALIATCAHRGKKHFNCSIKIVETFFLCQDIDFFDQILVDKIDLKGAIRKDPEILQRAYELGIALSA